MSLDLVSRYSLIDTYHSDAIIAVSSAGRMFTAQRVFVMDIENTIARSDYFEHVVLGAQGSARVVLLGAYLPSIPLNQLSMLNPVLLVFALPFMYVLGMMIDSVSPHYAEIASGVLNPGPIDRCPVVFLPGRVLLPPH
jgi:hypothetical protein